MFKIPEKRRVHNIKKMIEFFDRKQKTWLDVDTSTLSEKTSAKAALVFDDEVKMMEFMMVLCDHPREIEILSKYINTHRKGVREMTTDDLKEVQDFFRVKIVQEG